MLCLPAFRYRISVVRLWSALKDFGISVAYYVCQIFNIDIDVTVTDLPSLEVLRYLPYDVDEFLRKLQDMWEYVFDVDCFLAYITELVITFNDVSIIILLFAPLVILVPFLFKMVILKPNDNPHGSKSNSVQFIENKVIDKFNAVKDFVVNVVSHFWERKYYKLPFIFIWLLNFNVLTVAFEFLAWYFYFAFSFDILNLPIQFYKLVLDLVIFFSSAALPFWLIAAYVVICIIRKNVGYQRLEHRENLDRAFISRQPLIMMFTGSMGTGKTTALTSFLLSLEIRFRDKALELMLELDSRYPNFPWITFEDELRKVIKSGKVKNLTTCRDFIEEREKIFIDTEEPANIFGYDIYHYRYELDDNLTCKDVWKTLSDYACLYFIYIIQSSLIVSNYSVRTDNSFLDNGNFPLWDTDLFKNSPRASEGRSRRSHILDYDIFRLGRHVLKNNPRRNSFEFGVVGLSEFAKERGNQVTLQDVKKSDEKTNQKNDLFAYGLKMCRHKATICGFPFITFVSDEQRPDSLGADTRELLSIINLDSKDDTELLMPMYFVEEFIHDLVFPRWQSFYVNYRYLRGDTCLPVYVAHNLMSLVHIEYRKKYNLFGYNVLNVTVQSGKMDSEPIKDRIHILHKKVYSDRFATDCHYGFFAPGLRDANCSFDQYAEYNDTVASVEELLYQNSYFISDMNNINSRKEKENE